MERGNETLHRDINSFPYIPAILFNRWEIWVVDDVWFITHCRVIGVCDIWPHSSLSGRQHLSFMFLWLKQFLSQCPVYPEGWRLTNRACPVPVITINIDSNLDWRVYSIIPPGLINGASGISKIPVWSTLYTELICWQLMRPIKAKTEYKL